MSRKFGTRKMFKPANDNFESFHRQSTGIKSLKKEISFLVGNPYFLVEWRVVNFLVKRSFVRSPWSWEVLSNEF